eukprot:5942911-Amphidinium_carterae.1
MLAALSQIRKVLISKCNKSSASARYPRTKACLQRIQTTVLALSATTLGQASWISGTPCAREMRDALIG